MLSDDGLRTWVFQLFKTEQATIEMEAVHLKLAKAN